MRCPSSSMNLPIHSTVSNTGRFVVPTGFAGFHVFGGSIEFASNTVGYRAIGVRLNGTTILAYKKQPTVVGDVSTLDISTGYYLNDGDYLELIAYQNSGGGLVVNSSGNYSPEAWMYRVAN